MLGVTVRGQVEQIAGEVEAAQDSLKQAQAIAAELKVTEASELAQAIENLSSLLPLPSDP